MDVGWIGLGRMGVRMGARLVASGHTVWGHDRSAEARRAFRERGGAVAESAAEVLKRTAPRRVVWLMLPAGRAVDEVLDELAPGLAPGDVVVDGGNSFYRDTLRRAERLREARRAHLVDVGTSGGVRGEEHGFCMMVGGDEDAVAHLQPLLVALAPGRDRGWGRVGGPGAGHFVKMVHNGVEYGMMQAYAEGFAVLDRKTEFELDLAQVAGIWRHGSVVRSWLLDLLQQALAEEDLADIQPRVADSGEGRWAAFEAIDLDVPAPVLTLALIERLSSRERDSLAHRLLAALRGRFGGHAVQRKEA